ncbi:NADH:flavin oxidoreductase/NADH oxidase [Pseudomonas sp. B21-040]|uniref:NADH:flavin oxidoreductase/NADH oxidase n=1 Tax=Pseudomonas sp. B21-040 TaxID=2895486 RepID=UPI00215F8F85|nr:NADH:flavin oxidoreductase/NADH oxidase [Pseudomonas sp. B21-040]UVL38335.1 NADH:flavin oxidoreductase/NADH oxidase [Pseudomonas sp. B21-040]
MSRPPLFTPFESRGVHFRNRLVVSPMCQYQSTEGLVNDWHYAHHARFALGGIGGALLEATAVMRDGRISPGCLGIWNDDQIAGLRRIAGLYHQQGVPLGVQLAHAGRKASSAVPWLGSGPLTTDSPSPAWPTLAPSALAHNVDWPTPAAASHDDIQQVIQAFAQGARRAVEAGLDFVEIHGAHGYLIHEFFSPLANLRTDAYGGDFANRARLALEVVRAVRAVVPSSMPVWYRASCVDDGEGGISLDDSVRLAALLAADGVDLVDCSAGGILGPVARSATVATAGHQVPYAARIRAEAEVATMAVGMITEAQHANQVIAEGAADLVALGRALLDDPSFAYHAALELQVPDAHDLLPQSHGFFLARRQARTKVKAT